MVAIGLGIWLLADAFPGSLSDDSDQISLIQSLLIVTLISSGLITARKISASKIVRGISAWVAIAAVILLGYTYQEELKAVGTRLMAELVPSQPVQVGEGSLSLTRAEDGHFYVRGWANQARVRFLIDTGATGISISPSDARRMGINLSDLRYTKPFQTANGMTFGAPYRLDMLSIGSLDIHDVSVSINKAEMNESLLGMSFLNRLSSFEVNGRELILRW